MGEALDIIPSILNKCLFVSPDRPKPICLPNFFEVGGIINYNINQSINQFNKRKIETSPMTLSSVAILTQE